MCLSWSDPNSNPVGDMRRFLDWVYEQGPNYGGAVMDQVIPDGELVVTYLDGQVRHYAFSDMDKRGWKINRDLQALVVQEDAQEGTQYETNGAYELIPLINVRSIRAVRNSKEVSEALRKQRELEAKGIKVSETHMCDVAHPPGHCPHGEDL